MEIHDSDTPEVKQLKDRINAQDRLLVQALVVAERAAEQNNICFALLARFGEQTFTVDELEAKEERVLHVANDPLTGKVTIGLFSQEEVDKRIEKNDLENARRLAEHANAKLAELRGDKTPQPEQA